MLIETFFPKDIEYIIVITLPHCRKKLKHPRIFTDFHIAR